MARKVIIWTLFSLNAVFYSCKEDPQEMKLWAWSHSHKNYSEFQWDSLLTKMERHGFQGMLLSADSTVLKKVIPIAAKHNIEIHAWMWAMNRGDAKPEWLSVNALGESLAEKKAYVDYYKFMCPALPEVRNFIKEKVLELSKIEGLEGVHLDYIRYVDVFLPIGLLPKYGLVQDTIMPQFDYGYHPFLREKFKEKFGQDPFDLPDMQHNTSWMQFRLNQVTETVNDIAEEFENSDFIITAAVFPEPEMSVRMVRQEWDKWNINSFYPMVYYNFYNENSEWVGKIIQKAKSQVSEKPIYCGLYVPAIKSKSEFQAAINQAIDNGADGISLFEISSLKDFHWEVLKEME